MNTAFFLLSLKAEGKKETVRQEVGGVPSRNFFPSHEVLEKWKDPKSEEAASPLLIVSSASLTNAI